MKHTRAIVPRQYRNGVVDQVRTALRPRARLATALGFLLGGFVPLASYMVAHYEVDRERSIALQFASLLVLGGLIYSARTVYEWGMLAFRASKPKAIGFVVLLEGTMVVSGIRWLGLLALAYLVAINGIATGCHISRGAG